MTDSVSEKLNHAHFAKKYILRAFIFKFTLSVVATAVSTSTAFRCSITHWVKTDSIFPLSRLSLYHFEIFENFERDFVLKNWYTMYKKIRSKCGLPSTFHLEIVIKLIFPRISYGKFSPSVKTQLSLLYWSPSRLLLFCFSEAVTTSVTGFFPSKRIRSGGANFILGNTAIIIIYVAESNLSTCHRFQAGSMFDYYFTK